MPRPRGKKVASRLSVGLSEPQHAALVALADQNEATVAWLVRRAIAEFLEKHGSSARLALRLRRVGKKQARPASAGKIAS
jgi:hypothetical protein